MLDFASGLAALESPEAFREGALPGIRELVPCLDLGKQYLSSIFPTDIDYRGSLQAYPMELTLCAGPIVRKVPAARSVIDFTFQ